MLRFADGQTDSVITIGHPPSGGALTRNHLRWYRYDRTAKRQHNWRRPIENKHKCRGKHKILYDLEQTKARLMSHVKVIFH